MVLVGARDLEEGKITLKDMESGDQEQIPIKNITSVLLDRIKTSE
ncbi:hypothetical protein GCM10025861_25010 [Methanobacterium petrolearium]|nr:hypothetical protein GCM10025861_25010 [Methanobacterium petrolearium]